MSFGTTQASRLRASRAKIPLSASRFRLHQTASPCIALHRRATGTCMPSRVTPSVTELCSSVPEDDRSDAWFDQLKAELCQGGRGAGLQFHGRPENIDAHIDQDIGKDRSTAARGSQVGRRRGASRLGVRAGGPRRGSPCTSLYQGVRTLACLRRAEAFGRIVLRGPATQCGRSMFLWTMNLGPRCLFKGVD